jgi:hypothetical protein
VPTIKDGSEQWVLLKLEKQLFGIPGKKIKEMVTLPDITRLPNSSGSIRGIINLRGRIIPVMDLRLMLGFPSRQQQTNEMCEMMAQREQDHMNWLGELEASVKEEREFTLTTDPHKCKFGKWYYSYHAEDPFFKSYLNRFESPHNRIHAMAITVRDLHSAGNTKAALRFINECRETTMQEMLKLFSNFAEEYSRVHPEIGVIMEGDSGVMAVSVDSAVSMESIQPFDGEELRIQTRFQSDLAISLGRRQRTSEIVVLLDPARLSA